MSVVSVKERWGDRTTTEDSDGLKSYGRVFIVETDGGADDHGDAVLASTDIPQYNDAHPTDLGAFVRARSAPALQETSGDTNHWLVRIGYAPIPNQEPGGSAETQILHFEPNVEVSFRTAMVVAPGELTPNDPYAEKQAGGKLFRKGLLNSAGEPFDPPILVPQSHPILNITMNVGNFDSEASKRFVDSVNFTEIVIAGFQLSPHEGLMVGITTSGHEFITFNEVRFSYYRVTFTIHVKWGTWDPEVLNQGTYYLDGGAGGDKTPFLTVAPNSVPYIGLLTLDGDQQTDPNNPTLQTFRNVHKEEEWGDLSLPMTMPPIFGSVPRLTDLRNFQNNFMAQAADNPQGQ